MLHMNAGQLDQIVAMPHQRTDFADRLFGTKRGFQQTHRMQILKPLAIQHVGFATGNMVHMLGIDEMDFNTARFQNLKQRYPVHTGRFHGHRVHTTLLQPIRQSVQIFREGRKRSHRFGVTICGYRDENLCGSNIHAAGIGSHHGQMALQLSRSLTMCLCHGSSPLLKVRQRARCAKGKIYQAGSSQRKQRLRVTSVVAHGPGTKLLHGLAEASTNGIAAYTYRRRAEFLKRETVETGPCANHASSLLLLVWPQDSWTYSFAKAELSKLRDKGSGDS